MVLNSGDCSKGYKLPEGKRGYARPFLNIFSLNESDNFTLTLV